MDDATPPTRQCTGCYKDLPLDEFAGATRWCRECCRQQERRRRAISYEVELEIQGGGCAICKRPPLTNRQLCLDHDHRTGLYRGLLCDACNQIIAKANDDPTILRAAILYLCQPGRKLRLPPMQRRGRKRPTPSFPVTISYREPAKPA